MLCDNSNNHILLCWECGIWSYLWRLVIYHRLILLEQFIWTINVKCYCKFNFVLLNEIHRKQAVRKCESNYPRVLPFMLLPTIPPMFIFYDRCKILLKYWDTKEFLWFWTIHGVYTNFLFIIELNLLNSFKQCAHK